MFWTKFVRLCTEHGTKPTPAGEKMGFSSATVVGWKKGAIPQDANLLRIADYFNIPVSYFDEDVPEGNLAPAPGKTFNIPVFESVSAGFGAYASSAVIDRIPMFFIHEADAKETIAVKVCGDSMYPTIEDGDTVVVRKTDTVDSGTVAVVLCEDEGYIKRIEFADNKVILRSINPLYPPITFEGADILRLRVVGKVIKVIKDFE